MVAVSEARASARASPQTDVCDAHGSPSLTVGLLTSVPLQQQRDAHTATNAQCREPAFRLSPLHLIKQRRGNSRAGATYWMAQSDCAAVNIQTILIELKIAIAGNDLGRECFIEFDEIDVVQFQFLSIQNCPRCRHWANAHDLR